MSLRVCLVSYVQSFGVLNFCICLLVVFFVFYNTLFYIQFFFYLFCFVFFFSRNILSASGTFVVDFTYMGKKFPLEACSFFILKKNLRVFLISYWCRIFLFHIDTYYCHGNNNNNIPLSVVSKIQIKFAC